MTNNHDRLDPLSDEQRRLNRENHGKRWTFRIPIVTLDDLGMPTTVGYESFDAKVITDPTRLGEGLDIEPGFIDGDLVAEHGPRGDAA